MSGSSNITSIMKSLSENIKNNDANNAVVDCLKLSRITGDIINTAIFMRELDGSAAEVGRIIFEDGPNYSEEAKTYIFNKSMEQWMRIHTIIVGDAMLMTHNKKDREKILKIRVHEIDHDIENCKAMIADLTVDLQKIDYYDEERDAKSTMRLAARERMSHLVSIKSRIISFCAAYLAAFEKRVESYYSKPSFMAQVQIDVDAYYKEKIPDLHEKLKKAVELSASAKREDQSLLLTCVRRALNSYADHVMPPSKVPTKCSDGKMRVLGTEQYLNRIEEYINRTYRSSTARDMLKDEINYLMKFIRTLSSLSSKGVHSDVPIEEARQGLTSLYSFLANSMKFETVAPVFSEAIEAESRRSSQI